MKSKFFFFGAVVVFLFSLFVFFFGLVSPQFVGIVTKSAGIVAVKQVEQRNPTVSGVRVDTGVIVSVVKSVNV